MENDNKGDNFDPIRVYAKKLRNSDLRFNSEHLKPASDYYVGWIDLMGSGHVMSTSVQKSANFLARLHIAVERARAGCNFSGRLLPINDGIFIISESKCQIISMLGRVMILLSANFIAIPRPHDRFLLRGGIAYGPIYFGENLVPGLQPKKFKASAKFLDSVMFGPALIQAYRSETNAPPYGIAIHESARAFHPAEEQPFRMTHWMWWAPNEPSDYPKNLPPMTTFKNCLWAELKDHFDWLIATSIYHGLEKSKINQWAIACKEYFQLG
ncbi:hypothetical protein KRIGEM_02392 [Komagataeibacter rhaeticus]|nr:hypothetical protein KRIGEM_02392 [Komagataeibacter rhaeticus]